MDSLRPILLLLLLLLPVPARAGEALAWAAGLRAGRGLPPLAPDPALERAAAAYAQVLAASGRLSHRDASGRGALLRVREAGGSAARVGEILGAGPSLAAVAAAWEASPTHAAVALDPGWTHAGEGRAPAGPAGEVWVLLFAQQRVEGLALDRLPDGAFRLAGRFRDEEAAEPVLLSGVRSLAAVRWDPRRREFLFRIPAAAGALYHRLGYRTAGGEVLLTGAFFPEAAATSSPGTAPR